MAYIDYTYYSDNYKGTAITHDQFIVLSERASDVIDQVTSYGLHGADFSELAPLIQSNVKKATAAQVEYMAIQGGELSIHGGSPTSVNIGNFSYQASNQEQPIVSPAAMNYLKPTGLLYRGVSAYGR
ncbi:hypothetical protein ABC255_09635 [Neobacillus sp. 3P2-tot-E-2]|uniref:hypothetical protein n=1 Tax=Neobacillus sp. 3P2-tot-E-2 TaxID=3132212 RepID=UPI0039A1F37A